MTGLEIALLAGLGSAATAAIVPLLVWLTYIASGMFSGDSPQLPPPDSPPVNPPTPQPQQQENQRPEATEEEKAQQEQERQELFDAIDEFWRGLDPEQREIVSDLTRNLRFAGKRVFLGHRKTGEKSLGVQPVETPHPSENIDVRPLMDMSEVPQMVASEYAMDDDLFEARLLSGQVLVNVHTKNEPLMEDVYEPEFEESIKIVYVLLDVSPSMFDAGDNAVDREWRIPLFKAITLKLIERAARAHTPFIIRSFSTGISNRYRAVTPQQSRELVHSVLHARKGNGTDIGNAVRTAIRDFQSWEFTEADIMIVTDGEDHGGMSPARIREALQSSGIRLHSIMLGVENGSLREASDVYQIVEEGPVLHPEVRKS